MGFSSSSPMYIILSTGYSFITIVSVDAILVKSLSNPIIHILLTTIRDDNPCVIEDNPCFIDTIFSHNTSDHLQAVFDLSLFIFITLDKNDNNVHCKINMKSFKMSQEFY